VRLAENIQRGGAGASAPNRRARGLEHLTHHRDGILVVVNDQNLQARQAHDRCLRDFAFRSRMVARLLESRFLKDGHQWEQDTERRALPGSFAGGVNGAAVQLDQIARDGEAQSQPAVLPGEPAVGLPESFEDVRQNSAACRPAPS
jgi:hypothetical protein